MKILVDSLPYYYDDCPFAYKDCNGMTSCYMCDEKECPRTWDKYFVTSEENPHECLYLKENI